MAYTGPNSFGMIGGFNITSNQPIDSRIKVNDINDVINIENWRGKTGIVTGGDEQEKPTLYNGLIVSDNAGNVRVLVDADNWDSMDSWKEVGGSGSSAVTSESDPTASDDMNDGYKPGQLWINTSTKKAFILIDATSGAAVWYKILDPSDLEGTGTGDMLASVYAKNGGAGQGKVDHSLVSDKLATSQNIKITGDATGAAKFDGSAEANIEVTLNPVGTAGKYVKVTTDAKGRVTAGEKTIAYTEVTGLGDVATKSVAGNTGSAEDNGKIPALGAEGKLDKNVIPTLDSTSISGLGTAAKADTGTAEGNVPVLGVGGKLADSVLPALAITDVTTVDNMDALVAQVNVQQGDVTIVTNAGNGESKTFILSQIPAAELTNWKELKSPTAKVTSVNSKTGDVVLTTDNVNEGSINQYYTEERFSTSLSGKTTTDVKEGDNLYYKDDRVQKFLTGSTFIMNGPNAAGTWS